MNKRTTWSDGFFVLKDALSSFLTEYARTWLTITTKKEGHESPAEKESPKSWGSVRVRCECACTGPEKSWKPVSCVAWRPIKLSRNTLRRFPLKVWSLRTGARLEICDRAKEFTQTLPVGKTVAA